MNKHNDRRVRQAAPDEMAVVRALCLEYAEIFDFSLDEFQDFSAELERLPGEYSPPEGCLLLAELRMQGEFQVVGMIALRLLEEGVCEMKRMYLQPVARGSGLARMLVQALLDEAAQRGYRLMRLDTLKRLEAANRLYHSMGFRDTTAYRHNPLQDAVYMEREIGVADNQGR